VLWAILTSPQVYFGFLAWALPTNLLMQRLPVGRYLGFNIFCWGGFLMLQAAAKNFAGLAALRALAGAAEACSDPSFMLITSSKYSDVMLKNKVIIRMSTNVYALR
jgi:MFS family permease